MQGVMLVQDHLDNEGEGESPASNQPEEPRHLAQAPTAVESTTQKNPVQRTLSRTPFKKPPSTATMKLSRTPSSRSVLSSRSVASSACSSTTAVPVTINLLALSDRDNHPYQSLPPKHTFTLKVMPRTKVKEICLYAAEHMSRKINIFMDGSRFEARDQEGDLFGRGEMVTREILDGDPLYLIEDAVGSRKGEQKTLTLEESARKGARSTGPYCTPSLSSRTSSQTRKWSLVAKSEPNKATPTAQKRPELAQLTRSAPRPARQRSTTNGGELPQPRLLAEPTEPKTSDALAEAVASQPTLLSPESSPAPRDDTALELVIPDSQQDPASPSPSPKTNPPEPQPKTALQPPEAQPRAAAPSTKTVATSLSALSSVAPPAFLPSRPDPYDINSVLSDDDNRSPRAHKRIMSSFARKLGSSSKRPPTATRPAAQRPPSPLSTRPSSPVQNEPPPAVDQTVTASTPPGPAPTLKRARISSPAVPLPSSPTTHVAAAIAKDRAKEKRTPQNEPVFIYDSSDEVDEKLLHEAPCWFSSSKQSQPAEPLSHWNGPPKLQLSQGTDPFWAVRSVGRRPPIIKTESDDETKSPMRRLGELGGGQATRVGGGQLKPRTQSANAMSPPKASLSQASPAKKQPTVFPGRYPLGLPGRSPSKGTSKPDVEKSPVIEIPSSSNGVSDPMDDGSADQGLSAPGQEPSPSRNAEEAIIISSDSSSEYESEEEEPEVPNKPGLAAAAEKSSPPGDLPVAEELPFEDPAGLSDQEEPLLPDLRPQTPPFSTAPEGLKPQSQSKADAFVVQLPHTDPFFQNPNEESPPSAQPSKRKREPSDEPESEQEERKRLAAERARRRAQRLEIQVSSPAKAAGLDAKVAEGYEGSEESNAEDDQSPATPSRAAPATLDQDESNDSLSSKETEERCSWRELSKRHLSESPKRSQKYELQPKPKETPGTPVVEQRYQREIYDDWAFLQAHLGRSYEVMEVHDRLHTQVMHQGIRQVMATGREDVAGAVVAEASEAKVQPDVSVQTKDVQEKEGSAETRKSPPTKMTQKRRKKTNSRKKHWKQAKSKRVANFKEIRGALVQRRS